MNMSWRARWILEALGAGALLGTAIALLAAALTRYFNDNPLHIRPISIDAAGLDTITIFAVPFGLMFGFILLLVALEDSQDEGG